MKKHLVFGLALVSLIIFQSFKLPSSETLRIDLTPDFLGFILIYLGLEKISYRHRFLRELSSIAVFFAVISFLTFAAQLAPIYATAFTGELKFIAVVVAWIASLYEKFEFMFLAVYMLYIAIFCIAFARETWEKVSIAPKIRMFSKKNQYGDTIYSSMAYRLFFWLSICFSVLFFAATGFCVFYCFTEINIYILGIETGLWIILLPVSILFVIYENTTVNMLKNDSE